MLELNNLTRRELKKIGELILNEINIKLFNSEPSPHKAYQICSELIQEGYKTNNKELTCHKIYTYFKKRTKKNQSREFYEKFEICLNDRLRAAFCLSFRTSVIEDERIKNVASKVYSLLIQLKVTKSFGLTQDVLYEAIKVAYKPRYYENEWKITLIHLSKKINEILLSKNFADHKEAINEIFILIDPSQLDKENLNKVEKIKSEKANKLIKKFVFIYEKNNEKAFYLDNIIKDSEIDFINKTLEVINHDEITEKLETKLYQNDERHPLVINFINSTKQYNLIMLKKDQNLMEILSDLKTTTRSIRELGKEILELHKDMIQEKVNLLDEDIKLVS